jgi:hypothetical protein
VPTYRVRVALGERWCFQIGDDLEVLHADRLADIEPAARAWIAHHHGYHDGRVRLCLELLTIHRRARD